MRIPALPLALLGIGLAASAQAAPKVMICAADANGGGGDLQNKLKNTMAFAVVDLVDCSKSTPTVQQLKMYEAVLSYSDVNYADRATFGNNLADYVDAGGGVVLGQFALSAGFQIEPTGRWAIDNYNCITPGKILYQNGSFKQAPVDPNSPLVQGVTSITSQYRSSAGLNMAKNAKSAWDYQDGSSAVCQMVFNGHTRVDLNFYPGPPNQGFYQEGKAGDGATLIKNALLAVSGGFNPLKGMPNPAVFPDTGTGAVSNAITVTYTNTSMMAQTVSGASVVGNNAGDFLLVKAPQLPLQVASMATISFDVVFQPAAAGMRQAALSLGVNGQMSNADVQLQGNGIPSSVKVVPFPIAMGGTQQGKPIMKDVTITNTGLGKTVITDVKVTMGQAAYSLSNVPILPVALGAGGGFPVTLTFAPQMDGITTGVLTVTSTDPNTPTINVPISGYAGPPGIAVDANSVAFGNVNLGATFGQVINITNTGFSDLVIADIAVGGNNPGDFPLDKMMAVGTIGAQASQPFTISFKPSQLGQRSATITVSSNAGNKVIGLFGSGTMSSLMAMPNTVTFAPTPVKMPSMPQMVTIANGGNGTLKVSALTVGGKDAASFKVTPAVNLPLAVGPMAQAQVSLVCTPQQFGALTATLTIISDVGQQVIDLAGEGTAPVFDASPATIDFGQVQVQNPSMQPVTITNKGTDTLNINLINISGADNNDFVSKDLPQLPIVLAPKASTTFHVTFTPSKNAVENAQIDFLCDDPGNLQPKVTLTGSGIQAGVTVMPMTVDFGQVMVGTVAPPKTVTIKNTGDLPIQVKSVVLGGPSQQQYMIDMKGPFAINKGMSATVMVAYSPLTMGLHVATITITPMDLVPIVINVKGQGVAPSIGAQPSALMFGDVVVGSSSDPQTAGVKNLGTVPVEIEKIETSDPAFQLDMQGTMLMLASGATTTFHVKFSPSEQKAYSGKVSVTLKGQSQPAATITLAGNGTMGAEMPHGCGVSGRRSSPPGALLALLGLALAFRSRRRLGKWLFAGALLFAFAPRAEAAPKVLLCTADGGAGGTADIATKLKASMMFAAVDTMDCSQQTPTLDQLKMYEAVLTFDSNPFANATTLGNNLADYVDAGGGVVNLLFDMLGQMFMTNLQGRWSQAGYDCILPGNLQKGMFPTKQMPNDPNSPIVQGVTSISPIYWADGGLNMNKGATSVWDYTNGAPAVCKMTIGGHPRVDLNFFPGPPPQYYTEGKAGDGGRLIANALLYVSGGFNPLKGMPNPAMFPDTATGAISNKVTVTYTNTSMAQQTVNAVTIGGTHPNDFLLVKAPQLPVSVASMGTISFDLMFQPTAAGGRSATLKLGVAGQMFSADVTLQGNAIPASVKVSPYPIAMGGTQMGMPVMKDITISNIGIGKVNIQNIVVTMGQTAYTLSNGVQFPVALIAGGSFPMTVTFSPQMNGITNGILTVTSDDMNSPTINVPMSGYAGPPAITLDANSVAFGNVNLGASLSQVITITNSGFSDLTIANIVLGGTNPGDFQLDKMMAVGTIGAQQSQPFTVSFKPVALGQRTATVTVTSNDQNNPSKVVSMFGSGTTSMLTVMPNALTFPPTHVKTKSTAQMVTISNAGNGTLKVSALTFGGNDAASFSQSGGPNVPFTVGPNASVQVALISTPQVFGPLSAKMTVVTDVGTSDVTLAGEGTAPKIDVGPAMIDFGAVPVQTASMQQAVTLTNKGTDDLTINLINITGMDSGDFGSKDQPQPPVILKPNASTTFHVTFIPSKNAVENAEIDFLCDDPSNMQPKVTLTGNGTQAGVTVSPMTVDFKGVLIGTMASPLPVTITNTGDVAIDVQTVAVGGAAQSQFSVDKMGPLTIDKGQKTTLMIGYSPVTLGVATATLTITAKGLVPITINLRGTGTGPMLAVAPATFDFGPVDVGGSSEGQTFGLKNTGSAPLTIMSIQSSDPAFSVDTSATLLTLGPGMTSQFSLKFAPGEQKIYTASVNVTVKGLVTPGATTNVTGQGVVPMSRGGCACGVAARAAPSRQALAWLVLGAIALLLSRRSRRLDSTDKSADKVAHE